MFLDKNPFLFEKALDVVSRKWKGRPKDSRIKPKSRVSKDKIQLMNCDWNFVLNGPEAVVNDEEAVESE